MMFTLVRRTDKTKFRHLAYMYFEVYTAAAKVCSRCQGKIENVKVLAHLLTQSLPLQT